MSQLKKLQQLFINHLLAAPTSIVEHVKDSADTSALQRINIYASGYRLRLKEAITADFDCLHGYLGDEMFEQLMDDYIDQYQSHHTSLRYYSQHITEILSHKKPYSDHPEIAEIALIEQTFNNSFDAADCLPADIEDLGQVSIESWPVMQIKFHASLQLLPCEYNSFDIWKALSDGKTPPSLVKEKSIWAIWRKDLVSRYRPIIDAESYALTQLMQGHNFGELCEGLLAYFEEEQTPAKAISYLQTWITEKMVCHIVSEPN